MTMNARFVSVQAFLARAVIILVGCSSVYAQPIITSFVPTVGAPGDQVTLYGSGFSLGNIAVAFWSGSFVTTGYITSDTQMTVTVPNGISTGPISIQQVGGTPNYTAGNFTAIGSGPYIAGFAPDYGKTNDLIVINGVHLAGVTTTGVKFNGTNSVDATANADGTQINVHVPYRATSGFITVSTPQGTSNSPTAFTVLGPGPYILGFSPRVGTPGTTVSITGVQFTGVTNAMFNGKPGVNFAVQSDTLIRVDAPSGVTSGALTVGSALGSFTTSSNFFVPPTLTGFTPITGRQGTNVTLSGSNFVGVTNISFGGVTAPDFVVLNNTNLAVLVPAGAVTGLLRVTAPAGSAFSSSNFIVQPVISGFSPGSGPVGASVIISGANFNVGTPVVKFNGITAAAPTSVSFGQLTAVVPTGATTGPISISTTNGAYTNSTPFYLPAKITTFNPTNSFSGTRVTLSGQNFTGATGVTFNGTPAADFTVTNNTTLGATVPPGVTTGPISVTTPAGTALTSGLFYGAPTITDFTPRNGLPGTNVTISGSNFTGATAVRFNGASASFVVLNNSQIFVTVPNGALSGPISVVAPGGTNTSTISFVLNYSTDLSVTMSSTPNPVTVGSNLLYTIQVVNKGPLAAPNVRLTNMLPANVTVQSVVLPSSWIGSINGNPIEVGVNSLAVSAPATLLVTVVPQTAGTLTSTAKLGSDYPDPSSSNNVASTTTTVAPLAVLGIGISGNQVQLGWPVALTNAVLETTSSLSTNSFWSQVGLTPVISGEMRVVTVTNSSSRSFYRLRN